MLAFVPARDAHLLLAIPALPFFPGPSGVSLLRLFLAEPLPIVVLSGAKHNIFCALFMTFLAKFPDYSHSKIPLRSRQIYRVVIKQNVSSLITDDTNIPDAVNEDLAADLLFDCKHSHRPGYLLIIAHQQFFAAVLQPFIHWPFSQYRRGCDQLAQRFTGVADSLQYLCLHRAGRELSHHIMTF